MATSVVAFPRGKTGAINVKDDNKESMAPTLPIHIFRPNEYMEIAFDTRTRTPIYVVERLEGPFPRDDAAATRRARFYEEASLPVEFRSRNGHYRGSGYDRGHLAPAADFPSAIVKDTYSLCNTIPQVPSMNRHGWAQLEAFVRRVAEREWNEHDATTHVVTGPLWLPSSVSTHNASVFHYAYDGIGTPPYIIHVPTHLYKVVAVVRNDTIIKFAAFVVPNKDMKRGQVDLTRYLVRITDLEAVCGMHFFPSIKQDFRQQANALTEKVWSLAEGIPTILLIEGGGSQQTSKVISAGGNVPKLKHLCQGGKCQ